MRAPSAPRDRQAILGLLAELGSGHSADPAEVSRLLAWRRPRWGARLRVHAVERTLEEAATLVAIPRCPNCFHTKPEWVKVRRDYLLSKVQATP